MKKLVLLGFITLLTLTHARMVDGIAMIVEGEPVTTAEIRAVRNQMHISNEQAKNLLIQDRLRKSAMKNIHIDETALDEKISLIAKQNHVSVPKMQQILKKQGTSWSRYRSSIRDAMKQEKFFQEHVVKNIPEPTKDELKLFYSHHKRDFTIPSTLNLIEYSASSEETMKNFLKTKNKKGIKSRSVRKSTKSLNPTLLGTILQTQKGAYTHPFNAGDRFISYKVVSKTGRVTMPFDVAKGAVTAKWKQKQQGKAVKDYFEKLKTNADVQYIR